MRLLFQCLVLALPAVVKLQYMSKGVDGCVDVGCQECEGDCDNDNECAGVLVSDQKKERKKYYSGGVERHRHYACPVYSTRLPRGKIMLEKMPDVAFF